MLPQLRYIVDKGDFNVRQIAVLHLVRDEPRLIRDLASELKISKPAVSRSVDKLGILGLTVRKRGDADRRDVSVEITEEGNDFLAGIPNG